eukprot:EG_transcript_2431
MATLDPPALRRCERFLWPPHSRSLTELSAAAESGHTGSPARRPWGFFTDEERTPPEERINSPAPTGGLALAAPMPPSVVTAVLAAAGVAQVPDARASPASPTGPRSPTAPRGPCPHSPTASRGHLSPASHPSPISRNSPASPTSTASPRPTSTASPNSPASPASPGRPPSLNVMPWSAGLPDPSWPDSPVSPVSPAGLRLRLPRFLRTLSDCSVGSVSPPLSPLPAFRRRLVTAASFAHHVRAGAAEETSPGCDPTAALVRLPSCTGLEDEAAEDAHAVSPGAAGPPPPSPGRASPSRTAPPEATGLDSLAAWRCELQRLEELEGRIERRDRRHAAARQQAEDQYRRGRQALQGAMWLTLVKVGTHNVADRLCRLLHSRQLCRRSLPIWRLMVFRMQRRRARQRLLQQIAPWTARLTPDQLRGTGPLFQDWPEELLAEFSEELQLCPFAAGEYICHQGDPSSLLYVLVAGAVDVVLRRPDSTTKARGKRTGLTVVQLTPVKYVGEYGVFAGEPRAATLYCASQVVAWAAPKECLVRYLKRVPEPVYCSICATFEDKMASIYRVHPAQLASTSLFQGWDLPTLEQVVARLLPVFFPEDAVILKAGSPGTAVFFVAKGRCHTVRAGVVEEQAAGALLGLRGCVFLEPHQHEVRACTTVQAWRLPKAILMDFLLRRPDRFLEAKHRLNTELAQTLVRPPLVELVEDWPLQKLPRSVQQQLRSRLQPFVVAPLDAVVRAGEWVETLMFLSGPQPSGGCVRHGTAGRWLGADELQHGSQRWLHSVTAQERVEGWRLPLTDVAAVLEAHKRVLDHTAMKALLVSVNDVRRGPVELQPSALPA